MLLEHESASPAAASAGTLTGGSQDGRTGAALAGRLRVRCWGTRGSLPSPGAATVGYGGNTSCVEVRLDGRSLILDAGSGISGLGKRLASAGGPVQADLFLTHFHWDHIQGLPFFAPLYDPRTQLKVYGSAQSGVDMRTLLAGQMGPTYFPIPYDALAAQLDFSHWIGEPWMVGEIEVSAFRLRHAGQTLGYRLRSSAGTISYLPDNELEGGSYAVPGDWRAQLVDFISGSDLLIHDAMYSDREYHRYIGWGHSTFSQAVAFAEEAGVRRLELFHHAPGRADAELDALLAEVRQDLDRRDSPLQVGIAREGEELIITGG
jgi:phosphoribosyl 1,2-cyclic phosphodiesterase